MESILSFQIVFTLMFIVIHCNCSSRTILNLFETYSKYASLFESRIAEIRSHGPVKIQGVNATVARHKWECPEGSMSMPKLVEIESGSKGIVLIPTQHKKIIRGVLLLKKMTYSFNRCKITATSVRYKGPIYGTIDSVSLIVDIVVPAKIEPVRCKIQSTEKVVSTVSFRSSGMTDGFFKDYVVGREAGTISQTVSRLLKERAIHILPQPSCKNFQTVMMKVVPPQCTNCVIK